MQCSVSGIRKFLYLLEPDPLVGGTDPDPDGTFYFILFCDFFMTFYL
jgi:hypothetical protein